ncbi:MAG: VacJ family lipoprotein [Methylibium sp.]|nr:VacJ family lipoprotein [Methylibium sp.]
MSRSRRWSRLLGAALASALLAGCATQQNPDPLEKLNRKVYGFNDTVDKYVIVPPARVYRDVVPGTVRLGVDNFFNNLKDAWSAVNLLLQGRPADSANDTMRFAVNTVLGIGGFVDWGSELGLDPHYEDFGQTLGVWGFEPGAYIVWPILGPSTVRDSIGLPIDIKASPDQLASPLAASATLTVVRVINTRAGLLGATNLLDDIALDKYTFVRDAFLQRRRSLVYDGDPPEDDYDERPDLPLPAPGAAPLPSGAASEAPVR